MKSSIKLIAVIILPFYFSACSPAPEPEFSPREKIFEVYRLFQDAEKLELKKENDKALAKLHKGLSILNEIRSYDPEWAPIVVDYRYFKIRQAILRMEQQYAQRTLERYLKHKTKNTSK